MLLLAASCNSSLEESEDFTQELNAHVPADCRQAIDTFITAGRQRDRPHEGIAVFTRLAQKYPLAKDSIIHATLNCYCAQIWDVLKQSDSMLACCNTALSYFDNHPEYIDARFMCHFYSGWAHTYRNQPITANYYFSQAGNELLDTVYVGKGKKRITSHMGATSKAALLEEIAGHARYSGLLTDARHYIRESLNAVALSKDSIPFERGIIYLEASSIYNLLPALDTSWYYLQKAYPIDTALKDGSMHVTYLDNLAEYYAHTGDHRRAALTYREMDSMQMVTGESDPTTLAITQMNIAAELAEMDEYAAARKALANAANVIENDTLADANNHTLLLLNQLRVELGEARGAKGRNLLRRYLEKKETLTQQQHADRIAGMNAQYSLHRKEDNIARLGLANAVFVQKVKARERLLVIAVLGFLLLVAGAIIAGQRTERRRIIDERNRIDLEQRLLRSQMEPHFIFNTLSVLQGLIRSNDKERSVKYLNRFARLLRISLEHAREGLVPLQQEVEALGHYLSLQSIRFTGVFTYEITTWEGFEEDADGLLIPPMLLQPFAENAVQHGMAGKTDESGRIRICISMEKNGVLRCTIADNGKYKTENVVQGNTKQKRSLSTLITRERLAILSKESGKPAGVEVVHNEQGSTVTILIPV